MVRVVVLGLACLLSPAQGAAPFGSFFTKHCVECHDADTKKGNLDLTALRPDFADAENFARWVKLHDRVQSGEMPPAKKPRPATSAGAAFTLTLGSGNNATFDGVLSDAGLGS